MGAIAYEQHVARAPGLLQNIFNGTEVNLFGRCDL